MARIVGTGVAKADRRTGDEGTGVGAGWIAGLRTGERSGMAGDGGNGGLRGSTGTGIIGRLEGRPGMQRERLREPGRRPRGQAVTTHREGAEDGGVGPGKANTASPAGSGGGERAGSFGGG